MSWVVLVGFLMMIWKSFDEVNVVGNAFMMIIFPCDHPYMLEGLAMTFGKVFVEMNIVYLGG